MEVIGFATCSKIVWQRCNLLEGEELYTTKKKKKYEKFIMLGKFKCVRALNLIDHEKIALNIFY